MTSDDQHVRESQRVIDWGLSKMLESVAEDCAAMKDAPIARFTAGRLIAICSMTGLLPTGAKPRELLRQIDAQRTTAGVAAELRRLVVQCRDQYFGQKGGAR